MCYVVAKMLRRLLAIGRSGVPAFVAVALGLAFACASPTLPLPPPEVPSQTEGADADHIVLSAGCGGAEGSAVIVILNENPALRGDQAVSGSLASPCGQWDAVVYAHTGDTLAITQESGDLTSQDLIYTVR
jgi:hypothetical protein